MSVGRRIVSLLGQITKIAREISRTSARLRKLELELAHDLAAHIHVPADAVVVVTDPIPTVELKVPISLEQQALVEKFLDILRTTSKGMPRVNARISRGASS